MMRGDGRRRGGEGGERERENERQERERRVKLLRPARRPKEAIKQGKVHADRV